jgi:hypothetical protein
MLGIHGPLNSILSVNKFCEKMLLCLTKNVL